MKKLCLLSVALMITTFCQSQGTWIQFTDPSPQEPEVQLITSSNSTVQFQVEFFGMYSEDIAEQGDTYQRLSIPGCRTTIEMGEPELPYLRKLIAIPECSGIQPSISVTSGSTLTGDYLVYPAPDHTVQTDANGNKYVEEVFSKDQSFYNTDQVNPVVDAEIVGTGYMRGQRFAEVYIYPVLYNPYDEEITANYTYTITLSFTSPTSNVNEDVGIFNNVAGESFINYTSDGTSAQINDMVFNQGMVNWYTLTTTSDAENIYADYLIITDEDYWTPQDQNAEINQLAQHRAYYNGFDVGIVKIENILSLPFQFDDQEYQDEQKLRSFLKEVFDAENANHTYDGKLGYVILVGDHDDVPTSYDQNPGKTFNDEPYPSDYYFTCLTSENGMYDEIGEFFIGRLSIQNSTELDNFINKITYFENEYSAGQWRNNVGHAFGGGMATGYPQIYNEFVEGLFPNDDYELKSAKYPNLQNELLANINNGLPYLMLFGHGSRTSWEVITSSEFQTYLTNVNKTPVALGYSCKTGEFDSPYEQCLAEVLTTYSATKGMAGYLGAGSEIWSSSGTTYDLPLYHREYSPNNILQNLSHICGEFIYESNVNSFDVSYPFALNYFGDPAMNIMATGYEVTTNLAIPDETVISSVIYVRDGATVTISPYSNIYFESNGKLIIEDGGKLNLYGGSTIHGLNENNAIVIQGDLNSGNTISSVTFTSTESNEWTGLVFEDETSNYGVNSCVFENCGVSGYAHNLDVDNTDFDNAFIEYSAGKLDVNGCDFIDSYIYAFDGTLVLPVQVINSTFNNTANNNYPIKIDNYRLFDIHGNDIKHNDKTGIAIYNSKGTRGAVIQDIYDNTIYSKTAGSGSTDFGIRVYNSHADIIDDNYIYNNYVGVVSYNTSEVNIVGDCNAANEAEAQRIKDNSLRQVYTDENSFPTDFMYNVIYDANANTYYVYYDRGFVGYPDTDIRDNYWGTGFVPGNNLYPAVCFIYSPTWNFGCTKNGSVESKYDSAVQFIVSQDYLTAETLFKEIVVDSPDSKYAKASIKQLFSLKELYDNDYESLKSFYDTTSVLQDTTDIAKLADWLSNKCDVKLQNYQTAINWYEDIIENPESENDSTFAIIDLGYLYLIMEDTSQRQGMACRFPQYRFSDRVNYTKYRDKLLDNLYCGETTTGINEPELNNLNAISNISISPNPVFTQVNIDLSSKEQGLLNIEIYDMSGRLILKSNDHTINKGSNSLFIDLSDHPKGVYNCTFNLNNNSTLTKKIIKL